MRAPDNLCKLGSDVHAAPLNAFVNSVDQRPDEAPELRGEDSLIVLDQHGLVFELRSEFRVDRVRELCLRERLPSESIDAAAMVGTDQQPDICFRELGPRSIGTVAIAGTVADLSGGDIPDTRRTESTP